MMKFRLMVLCLSFAMVVSCGSPEQESNTEPRPGAVESAERQPASEQQPSSGGDPCDALDADLVRYDSSGKHIAYSFSYPDGWEIDLLVQGSATSIDVKTNVDAQGADEFVFRFGHMAGKPMENVENLVATWRQMKMIEEMTEIDVEGRTMYLARSRIGEMTAFQALFPDVRSDSGAWLVSGGVVSASDGCEEQAVEMVERIMSSFRPNPDIGPAPSE